jgi:hypothetical protein
VRAFPENFPRDGKKNRPLQRRLGAAMSEAHDDRDRYAHENSVGSSVGQAQRKEILAAGGIAPPA